MSMWNTVAVPLGIQQSVNTIFAGVLIGAIDKKQDGAEELIQKKMAASKFCIPKFEVLFKSNIFNNTYAIFYEIIKTLNVKVFSLEQIEAIVDNNRDLILDSPFINKNDFIGGDKNVPNDDDIINMMINRLKREYLELSYTYVTEDEFESACEVYTSWYRNSFMFYTANCMTMIMSDQGLDVRLPGKRKRHYQGEMDAREFYEDNIKILNDLEDSMSAQVVSIDEKWYEEDAQRSLRKENDAVFQTGFKEIDRVMGPFRRGQMLGILGPTKGGKTRLANDFTRKSLKSKLNVLVWAMEGTQQEWTSNITASMIADISYEEAKRTGNGKVLRISSDDIINNTFVGKPVLSKIIASAKLTLATSEEYGRLRIKKGTGYQETFIDELKAEYRKEPFDVIVIDSLVNIMSLKGKGKVERISDAYMELEQFIQNGLPKPVFCIALAQLKQEVIDFIRRHPEETIDITAGGESAETIRTPDATIGLFSSKEERNADQLKIYCVASRSSATFEDFTAKAYFDCCYFMSEEDAIY